MQLKAASLILILTAATTAQADGSRSSYGIVTSAGYDSNPLRVSGDGPSGAFAQLAADGSYNHSFNPSVAFFASGLARVRQYESSSRHADFEDGSLRAGFGVAPPALNGRLAIGVGGTYSIGRSTFVDRATGSVYEVDAVPSASPTSQVKIPDRFDFDETGAFLNFRFTQSSRLKWFLGVEWERTAYGEDYSAETELARLDYRSLTLEPGVSFVMSDTVSVGVSLAFTDLDYDERPALDEAGDEVPGELREYRYAQLRATFQIRPANAWSFRLGLRADDRDDTHAGYYDYGALSTFLTVDRELTTRSSVRLQVSWRNLDYDTATITDELDTVRATDDRVAFGRYELRIGKHGSWFSDLGTRDARSSDPVFDHRQTWFQSGFQFRR